MIDKLCKDCLDFNKNNKACLSKRVSSRMDLVTGFIKPNYKYASTQRIDLYFTALLKGTCGKSGRFWRKND